MALDLSSVPAAWRQPFTVADESRIDALDDDLRALVERYVWTRAGGMGVLTPEASVAYRRGWEAALEAAREALDLPTPSTPRTRGR